MKKNTEIKTGSPKPPFLIKAPNGAPTKNKIMEDNGKTSLDPSESQTYSFRVPGAPDV